MPKETKRAAKRRADIIHIVEDSDFLNIPTQTELAKHFGVCQQQIQKDFQVIRKEIPGKEPLLVAAQVDHFVDKAIARLNELRTEADSPRSEREMILAQMSILRQRVELGQKLGLISQPSQRVDNTIKIQWGKKE